MTVYKVVRCIVPYGVSCRAVYRTLIHYSCIYSEAAELPFAYSLWSGLWDYGYTYGSFAGYAISGRMHAVHGATYIRIHRQAWRTSV